MIGNKGEFYDPTGGGRPEARHDVGTVGALRLRRGLLRAHRELPKSTTNSFIFEFTQALQGPEKAPVGSASYVSGGKNPNPNPNHRVSMVAVS